MMAKLAEIMKRIAYKDSSALDERPSLRFKGDVTLNGSLRSYNLAAHSLYMLKPPDDLSTTLPEEESIIDYETDYAPFDPEKPVYRKYILPCHVQINGTINGMHTNDILTKDDIDDLGASHYRFINHKRLWFLMRP